MKTVVLIVSERFPKSHPKAGQPTNFVDAIHEYQKLHTIRLNYDYWSKQIQKVVNGDAVLSIRSWSGKPYASKQRVHLNLYADDGVGIQKIAFDSTLPSAMSLGEMMGLEENIYPIVNVHTKRYSLITEGGIAKNDGLSLEDFRSWFDPLPKEPCAIIHFTNFRYT